jgi:hypothetical protein
MKSVNVPLKHEDEMQHMFNGSEKEYFKWIY